MEKEVEYLKEAFNAMTTLAYKSVRNIKTRPVDIIVGTDEMFNRRVNFHCG